MSDNPLETSPERERRIRDVAYSLWEADGSPQGREKEFWERASELVGMEMSAGAGLKTVPSPDDPSVMAGQAVEEASIQDNLGELPERSADQGEHSQTPSRKNLRR